MSPDIEPKPRVQVAWTGDKQAERVDRIPIAARPGQRPVVVMSLGKATNPDISLPDLEPGDELRIGVDLEVTTDLTPKQAAENAKTGGRPAGEPYDYAPAVVAQLLIAADDEINQPAKGKAIALGESERMKLTHDQHHGLFVFERSFQVPREGLPWRSASRVNLVVSASHERAEDGHILIVGQNEFDGSIEGDMGALCAVRIRPASTLPPKPAVERKVVTKAFPIQEDTHKVVSSLGLANLRENEQLLIRSTVKASARDGGVAGRLKSRLFLADDVGQKEPDGKSYAASISTSSGRVTKANGTNCLPDDGEITLRKIGVLRIEKDAEKPVRLNLAAQAGDPEKCGKKESLAVVSAELEVVRFPPSWRG